MATAKKTAKKTSAKKTAPKKSSGSGKMMPAKRGAAATLAELFEHGIKDIYWAEKALVKALPKMIKNATSEELRAAIEDHIAATEKQVSRVEEIFELLGQRAQAKTCDAMKGLIEEAVGMLEETEPGSVRDAAIITAAQKVEHYEISAYGSLKYYAEVMGENEIVQLLDETLQEEKEADDLLNQIARSINHEAEGVEEE